MGRRSLGLALASLALVVPASAHAAPKAQAADPYKVLVVTSTTDALTTAGVAAITQAVGADGVVTAPAPAAVGAQFTPAGLDAYRAVVFLNTGMASPLTDAQRANFEAYFKKGGGFVGIGSAIETDPSWAFLTDVLGTRSAGRTASQTGTVKVSDRVHDATQEPAASTGTAPTTGTTSRRTSAASRTCSRPSSRTRSSPQPQGNDARRHRRRHDGRRPPGLLLQGLPGRPLVLHGARQHRRGVRRRPARRT